MIANNLADVLDFSQKDLRAPQFPVPAGPFGAPCGTPTPGVEEEWAALLALARSTGWSLPL